MNTCPNCNKPYQTGDEVCRTCGFILPITSPVIATGEILQTRYEIQELIHSGGMGYVYLATDKRLYDRICIVKQIKEPIKSEAHRKKLEEEALRMSKLDHPNVAMILDHFIDGGHYFLVVERIHGKTLSEVFKERRGHLTENEVVSWAISISDVVSYLHSEGIVHRDISPDNIMLTNDGSIKFIDFGTLREFKYIAPGGTVGIGKYGYTPPEQWQGKPEPRSDIFSLGATIYYLLTGFLPLSREYIAKQAPQKDDFNPSFPPIRTKNPSVSMQLEVVLQKALKLDVNDRYSSVEEFGEALRNLERVEVKKIEGKKIPVLRLETRRLDFADLAPRSTVTRPIIIRNTGTGKLIGELITPQPWIKLSPNKIDLKKGEWKGKVTVDTRRLVPGYHGAGEVNVTTNGGQAKITVELSVATEAKPKPIAKPKPVRISKPKEISKPKMPLRWVFISLGMVLFLIVATVGVYFISDHLSTTSATPVTPATSPPETTPPDATWPVISQITVAGYTGETATIIWETDEDTTGQVEYGLTDTYGNQATTGVDLTISHNVELTGLQPNTTYHFIVKSADKSGNQTVSADNTFNSGISQKDWKRYVNDQYGFSIQYPGDWVDNPSIITTTYHLAAFNVFSNDNYIPGVSVLAFNADAPISTDWIIESFKKQGDTDIGILSPLTETTLADGTKATTYKVKYLHSTDNWVTAFCLDADNGGQRIRLIVFTVEELEPYDEPLFSEIAHTLRFTQ